MDRGRSELMRARRELAWLAGPLCGVLLTLSAQARVLSLDGWSVEVPEQCVDARISREAETPGYEAEDVKRLEENPMLQLKSGFHTMPAHVMVDLRSCYPGGMHWNEAVLRMYRTPEWLGIMDPYRQSDTRERKRHQRALDWIMGENHPPTHFWLGLPIIEMHEVFTGHHQVIFLPDGRGVRVLTQLGNFEPFIRSGELSYVFQALLDRTDRYVFLAVPLHLDGLAQADAKTQFGFSWTDVRFDDALFRRAAAEFITQNSASLRPSLNELDAMVRSIRWSATAESR